MNFSRRQFLRTSATMSALSAVSAVGGLSLTGTARAADAITVQYGGSAWLGHYPAYLAMKTGALAAAGINQQWQSFGTSSARMSAVLSGGIDIACTGIVSALALMARGSKHFSIVAIPDSFSRVEGLLVRDSVRSIQDLKGKKVGVTFASSSHLLVLDLLGSAGLSNDVTLLNVPAPELPGAIQSGQIDAAAVWAPQFNRIRAMSGMKVLADDTQFSLHKKYGVTPGPDVLIVRNAWAEKNVDTVRKYLSVYFEASQMLRTKPEEAARSLIALTGMSALDQIEAIKDAEWYSLEQQTQLLKSPGNYVDGLQRLAEMLVTYKQIDKAPAVRQWVNTSYL
ncbi:ABC transporter substrate-binding protein [Pandoraea communis]|uniref:Glycine betaine ABC transporter substrate-binding protein n=1 Tax=Pandoraea communis TaxID=2508297 RepID=A0A5E4Z287_9BURK|nr:ABC transporter substrate-binding protein [Pandoraea communis]MDM8359757.1 ABC transporter substrate-binding protein [Pandoraea communis]VVE54430.1 glycine betaine ABC transporter substrate-binding protein [Pandoraea communis]